MHEVRVDEERCVYMKEVKERRRWVISVMVYVYHHRQNGAWIVSSFQC